MYGIKYTDLRGNIINENEALENGNYYKTYYNGDIVEENEIVKNKEIIYIHYFNIAKDNLCECLRQHMLKN
ncbi:hypothetical protein [Clostridium sp. JS66]|uniref:hypothetical protein n=1 Tax=Clostridium sp. JS66 TaxID=3064705 RepID=UPI00298E3432|nr:hypothetical protein [Clostridium sp. JS66]WPC42627.1 hypothetical protein Q6H37_03925 [Clostridium sp. JS66]